MREDGRQLLCGAGALFYRKLRGRCLKGRNSSRIRFRNPRFPFMSQALPLSLGLSWFRESCRAVRLQPLSYPAIVIFSLLVSGMLTGIPFIGTLLASLWMPYASVLTGFAARDTLAGRVPVYTTLIAIFRDKTSRYPLLMLGLISSVWMEVDMLIFSTLGAEELDKWKITTEGIDLASITSNFPYTAFAVMFLLYLPLLMMTLLFLLRRPARDRSRTRLGASGRRHRFSDLHGARSHLRPSRRPAALCLPRAHHRSLLHLHRPGRHLGDVPRHLLRVAPRRLDARRPRNEGRRFNDAPLLTDAGR